MQKLTVLLETSMADALIGCDSKKETSGTYFKTIFDNRYMNKPGNINVT